MNKKIVKRINDFFLAELEKNNVPWQQTWRTTYNYVSGKPYQGINSIITNVRAKEHGCPAFLTFRQIKKLGGSIKKGEHATPIVYWHIIEKEIANDDNETKTKTYPLLRYYNVWNIKQCTGIQYQAKNNNPILYNAEKIVEQYRNKPIIQFGDPAYDQFEDIVYIPNINDFKSSEDYYAALFHELAHSTGHHTRLSRFKKDSPVNMFGSASYSFEELIAEISSAYLRGLCGIESTFDNSMAYIKGWLRRLKNNPEWIIKASTKATKACQYILGEVQDNKQAA